jgi:PAS domain S-box-containing protein
MAGKPGKSLLTTWQDDPQESIDQLWDEIEARFGICPSFFKLAQNEPPIARNLFRQAEFAYLDNPMPAHFKERLFTWLSRFCEVRYCVARHCAFLIGCGRVAGDAGAPPISVELALALLKELMPDKEELPGYLRALEETSAPLGDWPDFDSDLGRRFRVACAVVFLDPVHAAPWLRELLRLLGPPRYEQLMLFLAFVGAEHFWTEVHPELAFDPDLMAMLREHEALVEPLLRDTDEAVRWELGRRLCDELQGLREGQKSVEALRDSEARFRAIFENAAVGIARLAPDGHWLEVNQRLCDIIGYSREELMTKNFADITHPDDLEQDLGAMRRLLAGEIDTYLREKRYYRKDGSVVWANLTVSTMFKADGSPDYFISIVEDISARKRAEEKLLEREERLLLASWVSGLGIFEWDVQADRAVWENERMYEIFGHTRADGALSRAHLAEKYIHPDDVATFGQALADGMKTGRPFHVGYRIRRKDGALRWLDLAANFELARDGAPIRMIGVLADITERKQVEEKLRESQERLQLFIEHSPASLAMFDREMRYLAASRRWMTDYRLGERDIRGQSHYDLFPEVPERWKAVHRRSLEGEIVRAEEDRFVRADGKVQWVRWETRPWRAADGAIGGIVIFTEEITERKLAVEALRESELRFRTMVSAFPNLSYETDADGVNIFTSDQWRAYTGMTAEESAGTGFIRAYHPDEAEDVLAQWGAAVRLGMSFERKCRIRAADGSYRWFLNRARPGRDAEGRIVRWAGSLTDIDDLIRAKERVRENELRFRTMISAVPSLTFETDVDGNNTFASDQWVAYSGLTAEETAGRGFARAFHPDDAEEVTARWFAALRSGTLFESRHRIRAADGSYRWFLCRALPARDAEGRIVRWSGSLVDVDDLVRAEEALRESELRFRTMVSAVPNLTFESDADGSNTFASDQWCAYTGMTAEETAGIGFARAIHPDDAEAVTARWFAAVRSGRPYESRHRMRAADGSYRWFLARALPGRDAEGRIVRWAGSLTDIDDLVRAEERVRESESRFRQLAESLPLLVWTCRADGTCDYVNPQFVAYTGIPEAKQLGFDWLQQVHPDDREPLFAAWNRTVATGEPYDVEYRMRRNDGVYRWFKTRAVALRDSDGKVVKWFGSNTDIDDHKRADQALRESRERLNGIVSSAMDAIITVDEEQRVVLFNEAAERMFGCPAAEALGHPFNRFIPERYRGAHTELVRRFGETGGASRAMRSLIALRADGTEFPIEAAISKVEVGGRKLYTFIQRDITERKQAEAEREQLAREQVARAAAEAANRSKDEFLAMVSHELRSPLNAILGYTRMLRSGPADREAINNVAAVLERSAKAQLQIIEDLLDSARIITGKLRIEPGPVDLVPVLEAALDTVRSAAEAKGVTLVANFGPLPEQALGDSTRLQQVVWNLLSNAVKFTPEGGRVELLMEGAADNVRITVSDSGKGVDPEFLPFVFDRFRQADTSGSRRYGGLGLGLSLVKYLVELHGGTITAASEGLWRGATFTVTLPRRHPEFIAPPLPAAPLREARTEAAITLDEAFSLEGVSVLVVDDQEEARMILTQALGEYGAQVTAVPSGAEALALLSDPPGGRRPDALILDIAMPGEDGYAVLKKVRALEAEQGAEADQIPAIALMAYGRGEDRLRALQAGFNMHVAKPVEPAELAVVVASLTIKRAWERGRKE